MSCPVATMPSPLDLTHAKVLISTPRINLRRATSYTHDRGPLSSTSSRFSFNHLVFSSPPPSPGLPQLIPRQRRSSSHARPSRLLRVVLLFSGLAGVLYLVLWVLWFGPASRQPQTDPGLFAWPTVLRADKTYEMVHQDRLPRYSTPAIVSDKHGNAKWTVSIPPNSHFPLATKDYVEICAKCREVASRVDDLRQTSGYSISNLPGLSSLAGTSSSNGNGNSYKETRRALSSRYFLDVHEAEVAGYLTGSVSIATLLSQHAEENDLVGQPMGGMSDRPVCGRSMTFVLASGNAGLGQTLMLLWTAYALAESEGRPFFIDDTRWAYGKYTEIFAAPPLPDCRPPLRHEMLPCPRQARHLLVTVETAGELFAAENDNGAMHSPARTSRLFELARRGHDALFKLTPDDETRVAERVKQLKDKTKIAETPSKGSSTSTSKAVKGTIVGMHVRRGDRHPLEFQYRDSYLPLNLYTDRAHQVLETRHNRRTAAGQQALGHSLMIMASDDPTVFDAVEFAGALRAQEYIRLASNIKAREERPPSNRAGGIYKFVDEGFGWEGGFFSAMFWNLGQRPSNGEEAGQQVLSPDTQRLRSLVGRAYMMDLAVLARASDTIVCAVSATGCRLLAVMMGREAAESQGQWINVDADYGWWPVDF